MNDSGNDVKRKFDSGEWLDKWRGLDSIWVDMSWFSMPALTLTKYIKCVGTVCGIGQIDWWYAKELEKLSEEDKNELESLCIRNKNIINDSYKTKSKELIKNKFKIITLCGSTRFVNEYTDVMKWLTLQDNIVISVGL